MIGEGTKKLLLVLLLAILVVVGARSFGFGGGTSGGVFGRSPGADLTSVLDVQLVPLETERLVAQGGEYTPGRDPWSFGTDRRELELPPPRQIEQVRTTPRPALETPVSVDPPKPKPPPVDIEYLGRFGPERLPIAVFASGEDVINALPGDVVNGKFRVEEIGYTSVQLSFVGFPDAAPKQVGISKKG